MRVQSSNHSAVALAVGVALLAVALQAQIPSADPELLSGEWETTTPSGGVHGVWLDMNTQHRRRNETTQGINVSIYHRQNGKEEGASSSENAGSFNGTRLRARAMDLSFDAQTHRWTGSWFLDGETRKVVLERPACQSHALCGTWEGRDPKGPLRLHIAQSSDGLVTAWVDRVGKPSDQRHGEPLRVVSSEPANFIVETLSAVCCTNRFTGRLTNDGRSLSGSWTSVNVNVDVQQIFRRIP